MFDTLHVWIGLRWKRLWRPKTKGLKKSLFHHLIFFSGWDEEEELCLNAGPCARCHAMDCKNGLSRHAPGARNSCSRRHDRRQREPNWSTWIFHYSLIYCLTNPAHYRGSGWQDPTVRRQLVSGVENWPIWSWAVFFLSVCIIIMGYSTSRNSSRSSWIISSARACQSPLSVTQPVDKIEAFLI